VTRVLHFFGAWTRAVVALVGALSIALLLLARWIDHRIISPDEALARAADSFFLDLTSAHLWLEEYVTGDAIDPERVRMHLGHASRALPSLVDPGGEERHHDRSRAVPEPLRVVELRRDFERFRELSETRLRGYSRREDVGVGSALDREYDAVFADVLEGAAALSAAADLRLARSRGREAKLFRAIVLSWTAIVALAVAGLWILDRRRRVAEIALAESRERLLRAQKTELAGRLASGLAHDLDNYLGAIRAHAELLEARQDAGSIAARVSGIVRVIDNASGLIDRLLAFARQQPEHPRILDPNEVLRLELVPLLRRLLADGVTVDLQLDEQAWPFVLDPAQFQQIVVNLAVNARDAMPEGGRIVVRTHNVPIGDDHPLRPRVPGRGDYAALSVMDTGSGVPVEVRPRIFEPFFSTKGGAGSSGLGLATIAGIVETAGGGVAVESEPGLGSTFTVLLPRSRRPVDRPAPTAREPEILVLESDGALRRRTADMLEAAGYRVEATDDMGAYVAAHGQRAPSFDLLIAGGSQGSAVVERLRATTPRLRVVVLAGADDDRALQGPADAVRLRTPFSLDELLDAVETAARVPA